MPMKLACASGALNREIESGELTQLEFLDLCARDLASDGVVLDVRHFPRTDGDYLAQLKKMAADRGLDIALGADENENGVVHEKKRKEIKHERSPGHSGFSTIVHTSCRPGMKLERYVFFALLAPWLKRRICVHFCRRPVAKQSRCV